MDISALNSFDAGQLEELSRLTLGKLPLDNADLAVALNNGVLDVRWPQRTFFAATSN